MIGEISRHIAVLLRKIIKEEGMTDNHKASDFVMVFRLGLTYTMIDNLFSHHPLDYDVILIIGFVLSLFIRDYPIVYTSIYMIITMMFSLVSNFSRAVGYVKQFAVAGIINTIVMGLSNILLLVVIRMGMNGYMLSMIVGQAVATIFLIFSTNLNFPHQKELRSLENSIV